MERVKLKPVFHSSSFITRTAWHGVCNARLIHLPLLSQVHFVKPVAHAKYPVYFFIYSKA